MATGNIKSRKSIHRDHFPLSTTSEENISHHNSQEEVSDGYESDAYKTQDSEESLLEQSSQTEKLKKRNVFKNNSFNDSAKDILHTSSFRREQHKSSFRHEQSNSMTLESAVIEQPSITKIKCISILLFIISVIFSIWILFAKSGHYTKHVCSFANLHQRYPKEGAYVWNHLQTGNENILNNESDKPAVFLFVHQGKQIVEKLINDIAWTSANCFGSPPIIEEISFTSEEAIQDYGHVIETFKKSIKEENVILIANLNKIPGEAAKALHSICDTVTPLVKKVIILLSLTVNQKHSDEKIIDIAENTLRQLWQTKIPPHELEPIITRVTDQVLLLQSN